MIRLGTMDRRAFLGSAASALLLPGCATITATRTARAQRLPAARSIVSPERVIRTVAGLRPYRARRLRRPRRGARRQEARPQLRPWRRRHHLVLGHVEARDPARPAGPSGAGRGDRRRGDGADHRAAGPGGGLSGHDLRQGAAARHHLQHRRRPVAARSAITGTAWSRPNGARSSPPRSIIAGAASRSWSATITGSAGCPPIPRPATDRPGPPRSMPIIPRCRRLTPGRASVPDRARHPLRHLYVETGRFLRQLIARRADRRRHDPGPRFRDARRARRLPERLVFNCTGLGARALFGDTGLEPVRGQLAILLPQPEVRYAFTGEAGYMFPRADGIMLGGTFERGNGTTAPEPEAIARHPRLAPAPVRRLPLHRLNSLPAAPI